MDMPHYFNVKVHKFMPGHNGGLSVKFSVMFSSNSSVTEHTVNQHLMEKIDDNGHLVGTTFTVSTTTSKLNNMSDSFKS